MTEGSTDDLKLIKFGPVVLSRRSSLTSKGRRIDLGGDTETTILLNLVESLNPFYFYFSFVRKLRENVKVRCKNQYDEIHHKMKIASRNQDQHNVLDFSRTKDIKLI